MHTRVVADEFGDQDVSKTAQQFAAVPGPELHRLFQRAVLEFYGRPSQALRLLQVTPWSALARQGFGVLRNLVESRA